MDHLPELPFEKILGYLSLEDLLKSRAISKSFQQKIDNYRVKSLCYSEHPSGFILGKGRWVSGAFAENFISSTQFELFFNTFSRSVLSSLKHLRLCDFIIGLKNRTAFARILNSFCQLEELDIIRAECNLKREFTLSLPVLSRIHLDGLIGIEKLTLDAPNLKKVKLLKNPIPSSYSSPKLDIVHCQSVETLIIPSLRNLKQPMKKLTKLNYLFTCHLSSTIEPKFLSSLENLKEVHLYFPGFIDQLFEQKQRYGRIDLKIYLCGLLLNGPNDPAIATEEFKEENFHRLEESPSRLAHVISFWRSLHYSAIKSLAPGSNVLNRFADLNTILVNDPVEDIERFLDLLKNFDNIVKLEFWDDQPQDLFDRLPEYCAVQGLYIGREISDVQFLFQLKNLVHLDLPGCQFDAESIRKAFNELQFLSQFRFKYLNKLVTIELVRIKIAHPKQFRVSIDKNHKTVSNLNSAIQFITKRLKTS